MIAGIIIGIVFMILLILGFAVGYGWDKQTNKSDIDEEL